MVNPYVHKQRVILLPYLTGVKKMLDFGCGDLSLAKALKKMLPDARITGVDVVDSGGSAAGIDFRLYNGKRLPWKDNTFDAAIAYHVFHHCSDPKAAFIDVSRVTKKTILLVEPVYRNALDLFFMKILDRLNNGWRASAISMPFTFQTEEKWRVWAREQNWSIEFVLVVGVLPAWLPFGVTTLFVLRKKKG